MIRLHPIIWYVFLDKNYYNQYPEQHHPGLFQDQFLYTW